MTEKKKWLKKGGGVLILADGRKIQPNTTFMAHEDEIKESFRDIVVEVDPTPPTPPLTSVSKFEVKAKSKGWYDVIEVSSGKALNEKALRAAEAQQLLESLE